MTAAGPMIPMLESDVVETSTSVLATHGRSFRLASHFLPRSCREAAAVVYAFCRLVDDLADEAPNAEQARHDLSQVLNELHGRATPRPLIRSFLDIMEHHREGRAAAEQLIQAVLTDLDPVAVDSDSELLRYCYGVAGTVGIMMCGVLGVHDPRALPHAIDLGIAMQITNICRDVREDAAMGRVYLPAQRLKDAGTSQNDLLNGTANDEAVTTVVRDLLELAETYYQSAEEGLRFIPARPRAAIVVASRVYRAIGLRLLRVHKGNPMHGRTVVPNAHRLWWVVRGLGAWLGPRVSGWSKYAPHQSDLHRSLSGLPGSNSLLSLRIC